MITRREFGARVVVGALGTTVSNVAVAQQRPRKNTLMHVGGDYHSVLGDDIASKQNLEYNLRHGVRHLTAEIKKRAGRAWDFDELRRMRDNCEKHGVVLEAFRMNSDYITLTRGPERDREIETIAGNIRTAAQMGVKIITYHWELIPFRRNAKMPGRGGATYDCFKLEDNWKSLPTGNAGRG
jgi:mannonate dehydratase